MYAIHDLHKEKEDQEKLLDALQDYGWTQQRDSRLLGVALHARFTAESSCLRKTPSHLEPELRQQQSERPLPEPGWMYGRLLARTRLDHISPAA